MLIKILGTIPFALVFAGAFVANRVTPMVFGLPLFLFWTLASVLLMSMIMGLVYYLDKRRAAEAVR